MVKRLSGRRLRAAEGFNLVTVVVIVTVLNIAIAAALPKWSQMIRRDKEEELIFRGLQYAEAIRVFQQRFGRYPVRLEELIEVNPRCIRQLWKDPMSEDGKWALIHAEAGGRRVAGRQGDDGALGESLDDGRAAREERRRPRRRGRRSRGREREPTPSTGPIVGVRSLSDEEAIKSFAGGKKYSEWLFMPDMLPMPASPLAGGNVPRLSSRWVGRPLPDGVTPQDGLGLDGAEPDDERRTSRRPRRPTRRRPGNRGDG